MMLRKALPVLALLPLAGVVTPAGTAHASGDPERGARLHAKYCGGCHGTEVYTRGNRQVQSLDGLMQRVEVCSRMLETDLSRDQVQDLVAYLNENFYRFK